MSSDSLDALYKRFTEASIENASGQRFLPNSTISGILEDEDDCLEHRLRQGGIEKVDIEEALALTRNGAQKIFVVLVLLQGHPIRLIKNFMTWDQMLQVPLDAKLPITIKDLCLILKDKALAIQFDQYQWEVLSPMFMADRSHRKLKKKTILPFIREERIPNAKGGYGIVSRVTLHQAHHGFVDVSSSIKSTPAHQVQLARKQIIVETSSADVFANEERIMRLLRLLRHENMVQLLASYSLDGPDGKPNNFLLMPLADMSLTRVLTVSEEGKAPTLKSLFGGDAHLLWEIHGISSALDQLHHYQNSDGSLRMKGCHFDLDPRNILIHEGKLLLADFGLSRLKSDSADSCTPFHGGGASHYTAPECLAAGAPEYHGSKSDMWSLGGIIFDIVACMMGGAKTVADFQEDRKHKAAGITSRRFHIGGACNPHIEEWVESQQTRMKRDHQALCGLAAGLLMLDPIQRPDSHEVADQLFVIAASSSFRNLEGVLARLVEKNNSLRLQLERMKLVVWARYAGLYSDQQTLISAEKTWLLKASMSHLLVRDLLLMAKGEVEFILKNIDLCQEGLPCYKSLQEVCERLWDLAPPACRSLMSRDAEIEIMTNSDIALAGFHPSSPAEVVNDEGFSETESRLLQLAAMRQFTDQVTDTKAIPNNDALNAKLLDHTSIEVRKSDSTRRRNKKCPREWSLVSMKDSEALFLCEWVYYDAGLMEIDPSRLHHRVRSIVHQLSLGGSHPDLRTLTCEGYFVKKTNAALGIVYSLPTLGNNSIEPLTMNQIISITSRPSLTEIFNAAKAVARSVFYFHSISWLHKNVSSYTILVFSEAIQEWMTQNQSPVASQGPTKAQPLAQDASKSKTYSNWWSGKPNVSQKADTSSETVMRAEHDRGQTGHNIRYPLERMPAHYLVGFNHSRADDKLTFTSGKTGPWYEYQHFRYANQSAQSFQTGYDYYSLGLVLLELGLWTPLNKTPILEQDIADYPLDRLQELLCEKALPLLRPLMGDIYSEAVRICLSDGLLDIDRKSVEQTFSREVLARLESCTV